MSIDLSALGSLDKLLFDVPIAPVQGHRFQPTGFPDLGAATFETESGTCLLVESAQSMANRLEATCWDEGNQRLLAELHGLSHVRVHDKAGGFLTSSLLEAHRLNSVYIEKADGGSFHKALTDEIGYSDAKPVDRAKFVRAVLKYDAASLLHGLFLESIGGRLRLARALTSFVEADGVRVAASGGVKNDHVKPGTAEPADGQPAEKKTAKEGYGNVPFHRDEYTARSITLFVNVDLAQIRGYGLEAEATKLLILLSLFKVRSLLDGKLRFRTACDFKVTGNTVKATNVDLVLPSRAALLADVKAAIKASGRHFAKDEGVTTVTFAG
jgi:CRISPR-associated protein Csb1